MKKEIKEKKRKFLPDAGIPSWEIRKFIVEHENDDEYKEEQKANGDDADSEWDRGYDACLDELKDFVQEFE